MTIKDSFVVCVVVADGSADVVAMGFRDFPIHKHRSLWATWENKFEKPLPKMASFRMG